jgi:hypothetical protein
MSKIFLTDDDFMRNSKALDHNWNFVELFSKFKEKAFCLKNRLEMHTVGYNHKSGNYYIYLENGISFVYNPDILLEGFVVSCNETGFETYHETYTEALERNLINQK